MEKTPDYSDAKTRDPRNPPLSREGKKTPEATGEDEPARDADG